MLKNYVIFVLFCTIHIAMCNTTNVYHDDKYDIIFHNGKLYFPSKNPSLKNVSSEDSNNNHIIPSIKHNEDEELVSGALFWFYIFIILCKKSHKISFNNFFWINVRFNCWIFIN